MVAVVSTKGGMTCAEHWNTSLIGRVAINKTMARQYWRNLGPPINRLMGCWKLCYLPLLIHIPDIVKINVS